jgi:DNA-binding transcriptional LysR family regulator
MRADPEDVVTFVRVAQLGSFSAAAKVLKVPKSSVSRRVRKLERTLSTQLLQRTTRSLRLTDSGRNYFERTSHALDEIEDAERILEGMADEPRGVLKLTIPIDLTEPVGDLIDHYVKQFPNVAIVTHVSNARSDLVREGYDLALRAGRLEDSTLVARKLVDTTMQLAASPAYLENHGTPKTLQELTTHQCVIFGSGQPEATWRLLGPAGMEQVRVKGAIAANDMSFLRRAAVKGHGIAWLPKQTLQGELRQGRLQLVLPEYSTIGSALYAVYPSARYLSPKVRHFVELCIARAQDILG